MLIFIPQITGEDIDLGGQNGDLDFGRTCIGPTANRHTAVVDRV